MTRFQQSFFFVFLICCSTIARASEQEKGVLPLQHDLMIEIRHMSEPCQENIEKAFQKYVIKSIELEERKNPSVSHLKSLSFEEIKSVKSRDGFRFGPFAMTVPNGFHQIPASKGKYEKALFRNDKYEFLLTLLPASEGLNLDWGNVARNQGCIARALELFQKNMPYYFPEPMPSWINYLGYSTDLKKIKTETNPLTAWQLLNALVYRNGVSGFALPANPYKLFKKDNVIAIVNADERKQKFTTLIEILPSSPTAERPLGFLISSKITNIKQVESQLSEFVIPVLQSTHYVDN